MIRLGIVLIILVFVAIIFSLVQRKVIAPRMREKRIRELEQQNDRLDSINKLRERSRTRRKDQ